MPLIAKVHANELEKLHDSIESRNRLIRKLHVNFENCPYTKSPRQGMIVIDRILSECEFKDDNVNIKTFPSEFVTNKSETDLFSYDTVKQIFRENDLKLDQSAKEEEILKYHTQQSQRFDLLKSMKLIAPETTIQRDPIKLKKENGNDKTQNTVINNVFHVNHGNGSTPSRSVMFITKGYNAAELDYGHKFKLLYAFNDAEEKIFIRLEETSQSQTNLKINKNVREFLLIFNVSYKLSSKINPPTFLKEEEKEEEIIGIEQDIINTVKNKATGLNAVDTSHRTYTYLAGKYPVDRFIDTSRNENTLTVHTMIKYNTQYLRDLVIVIYAFEFLKTIATLHLYMKHTPREKSERITGTNSLWDKIKKIISKNFPITDGKDTKAIFIQTSKMAEFVGEIFQYFVGDSNHIESIKKICLSETGIDPGKLEHKDFGHVLLVKILNSIPADESKINIITSNISGLRSAENMINTKITKNKWWATWESDCRKYHSMLLFSVKHKCDVDLPSLIEAHESIPWLQNYNFRHETLLRDTLPGENPKTQYIPLDFEVKMSIEQIIRAPYEYTTGVVINRDSTEQKRVSFKRLNETKLGWFQAPMYNPVHQAPVHKHQHRNGYRSRGGVELFAENRNK
jgi:hypothetical protein